MTIRNRELSQFGSFIYIDDFSKNIGIATETTPNISIGTTNATHKFTVFGDSSFTGDIVVSGISTFNGNVILGNSSSDTVSFTSRINSNILPSTDETLDFGGVNDRWRTIYATSLVSNSSFTGDIVVSGISTFNGNVILGNSSSDTVSFTSRINSNILPSTDETFNLGSSDNKWGSIYANSLVGIATSTNTLLVNSISNNTNYYLTFSSTNNSYSSIYGDSGILYNPNTNLLIVENISISGISTFNGNVILGNSSSDTVSFTSRINSNILPSTDETFNLGSSDNKWGSIYATAYENFKLSDLPTLDEPTFAADRVLKVKSDNSGYELVDILDLNTYLLRGFGLSNDGTVYAGIGSTVNNKLQISGISTSKLFVGEKVKVFGITPSTDTTLVPNPVTATSNASKVGLTASGSTYRYWIAQYHLRNGKVGISSQISPTAGIAMTTIDNFNDQDHISLSLSRTDTNHGILVYRQIGNISNINDAKLIAILGPKELSSSTSGITWKDYGVYEQPEWSLKGTVNEYDSDQIHFPNIATTGHRRGWSIDTITSIGQSSITLSEQYQTNIGIGTTSLVKFVHDNTYAFKNAIQSVVDVGKNSIELPSGTYFVNKISIPTGFTLKGNGKNTIIKLQHFATDSSDGGGNLLSLNGNMIGLGATDATNITIQDVTFDGNSNNNILFDEEFSNYLINCENISSSLVKSVEIRNTPASGIYIYNSRRFSIENSTVVDGGFTDRYPFQPLNAQESESLRINDCLFENYPGPVDLSVTTVTLTAGNIIRNCGTGLRTYAAGKITTSNNIILGPADEYIPTPDIYDSDYNSVNFTVQRGVTFTGPMLQYFEDGEAKNLSIVDISAGIGTIVGQGTTNETLGTTFLDFSIITPDTGTFGKENGYIQLRLNSTQTNTLGLSSSLGYDIIGREFLTIPIGLSETVGIQTGYWNTIGAGATNYTVSLSDSNYLSAFSVGDVVKLVNHSTTPDLSAYELTVEEKTGSSLVLTGFTTTSVTNGNESGYISIRNIFTIAKGRVGVI